MPTLRQRIAAWLDPEREDVVILREQLQLAIKAGRRCAHDLDHAADLMGLPTMAAEYSKQYRERAGMWAAIFYADGGIKDYRHRLHHDIWKLEREIDRLKEACEAADIDPTDPDGIPF